VRLRSFVVTLRRWEAKWGPHHGVLIKNILPT